MLFSDEGESGEEGLIDDDDDKSSEKIAGEEEDLAAVQDSQFAGEYGGGSSQGEHIFCIKINYTKYSLHNK